jgi:hypothetical protein
MPVWWQRLLLTWILLASAANADESAPRPKAVKESFSMDRSVNALILPGKIGDQSCAFCFSTGIKTAIIDTSLRRKLGDKIGLGSLHSGTNTRDVDVYNTPAIQFGSLTFTDDAPTCCCDLEWLRQIVGRDIRGMVGISTFRDSIIHLDFDKGRFDVLTPDAEIQSNWGEGLECEYDSDGVLVLYANPGNDGREAFRVVTGCGRTGTLSGELFKRLYHKNQLKLLGRGTSGDVLGSKVASIGTVTDFSLGSFRHERLIFEQSGENSLGLGYLRRFSVTIDFPRKKLYLAKGRTFSKEDSVDLSGLHIVKRDGKIVVQSVDPDSLAQRSGLHPRDRLVSIGTHSADELGLFPIHELLATRGEKSIPWVAERRGKKLEGDIGGKPER